jgi:hypothetical protein
MFSPRYSIALTSLLVIGDELAASQSATTPAFAHLSSLQQKEIALTDRLLTDYILKGNYTSN